MKKPQFPHCNTIYTIGWILTIPILIDISTCCTLFSFWIVWCLFFLVTVICLIRIVYGIREKCWKFCWGLFAQWFLGLALLGFFQLSFNHTINTPLSHAVTSDVVEVENPVLVHDSTTHKDDSALSADTISHRVKLRHAKR